jgi:hypothetical protein
MRRIEGVCAMDIWMLKDRQGAEAIAKPGSRAFLR